MPTLHDKLHALDLLDRPTWIRILLCCFIVGLLCYGYSFFNPIYAQDGAGSISQVNDAAWKISLGRYLQILNMEWRGYIAAPWLLGALSLLWISASSYIITKTFNIQNKASQYAITALLTTNLAFIATHIAFIHEIDAFALALLAASLSAFFFAKLRGWLAILASSLCITLCCGLYQPFLAAILLLLLTLITIKLFERPSLGKFVLHLLKIATTLLLGIALYYSLHLLILDLSDTPAASGYNSVPISELLTNPRDILTQYAELLSDTYYYLLLMVLMPQSYHLYPLSIIAFITLSLLLNHCIQLAIRRRLRVWHYLFLLLLILLYPLAFDITRILSRGISHDGTRCVGVFFYIITLILIEYRARAAHPCTPSGRQFLRLTQGALVSMIGIITFSHIIIANQAFLKRDLAYQSTQFTWARILSEVERMPDYQLGVTPIVLIGQLQHSPALMERSGFDQANLLLSVPLKTSIADNKTYFYNGYFQHVLGYPLRIEELILDNSPSLYTPALQRIPSFPHLGYCRMVDGKLYIKLSEPLAAPQSGVENKKS